MNLLGLRFQHRGLIRHADACEMQIRIKADGACGLREALQQSLLVATVADVVADVVHIGEREDDEIVSHAVVAHRAAGGGAGLLMRGLPWMIEVKPFFA